MFRTKPSKSVLHASASITVSDVHEANEMIYDDFNSDIASGPKW